MTAATQIHADLASLKNAIEAMSEGFSLFDDDNCLVLCNGRYREMYGYSESDACPGVHISKLLRMDVELNTLAQVGGEEAIRRRLETFGKTEETFDLPLADGRWVQVRDRKTSDGGIVCIHADISRHKKTEEALSDQLIFTEALVDIIPKPIFVKDPELRYVTFNRAFEEAFNMKREDYIGILLLYVDPLPLDVREPLTI